MEYCPLGGYCVKLRSPIGKRAGSYDLRQSTEAADLRTLASSCIDGISVFFPAFNDAAALPVLIQKTYETLQRCTSIFEIIVVNDGSTDRTAEVLAELQREYAPYLRVITHPVNQGYGAALRTGFKAANFDFIFYTDGDGQYDPRELALLVPEMRPGVGLVNGYKTKRNDPPHRIAIGWLYNKFARWLFGIQLRDIDCDFRLMRRSAFDPPGLRSTGGTICVELVRSLELSGQKVVEVPVSHYAREHGRSQFFRVRSLAVTFLQLCQVYGRLVVAPRFSSAKPTPVRTIALLTGFVALSLLAYGRSLALPFIADDYIQIQLGRDYGSVDQWPALAKDVLYRSRATSIVLTHWLEHFFGLNALAFSLAGLLLHFLNTCLVFLLGSWKPIGWRVSALAAAYFAFSQRHSEAVIWFSAIPELLVLLFVLSSLLLWIRWLQSERSGNLLYVASFATFLFALLSKESAVTLVPLGALAVLVQERGQRSRIWALAPFALTAALYFGLIYAAQSTHLHFSDGTFSLGTQFPEVIFRSSAGLLWVWGLVVLCAAGVRFLTLPPVLIQVGLAWMVLSLLPYSFLTYMPRVPSRHTYMASVGVALLVGAGFAAFQDWATKNSRRWLVPALATLVIAHECGYVWTVQHSRYVARAEPTERLLLEAARVGAGDVHASCFPYSTYIADHALLVMLPEASRPKFRYGPESAKHPQALDFCNATVEGYRY